MVKACAELTRLCFEIITKERETGFQTQTISHGAAETPVTQQPVRTSDVGAHPRCVETPHPVPWLAPHVHLNYRCPHPCFPEIETKAQQPRDLGLVSQPQDTPPGRPRWGQHTLLGWSSNPYVGKVLKVTQICAALGYRQLCKRWEKQQRPEHTRVPGA